VNLAVRIRLRRIGTKKKPFYRIVVADSRSPRDGRFIETLGQYNPIEKPAAVKVDEERVYYWFKKGALPTETVNSLLRRIGLMRKWAALKKGAEVSEMEISNYIPERRKKKKKKTKEVKESKETESQKAQATESKTE
jgi:small subunit ribosomal protein S16